MTASTIPPDVMAVISRMSRRIDDLERRLKNLSKAFRPDLAFSYSGPLVAATSPGWVRREAGRLDEVLCLLRVAGSTDTTIEVQKNGLTVVTSVILAGQLKAQTQCSVSAAADQDVFHSLIATAGIGAEDLTVEYRWNK